GHRELHFTLTVLDLDCAQRELARRVDFNFAVRVLDLHVTGDVVEVNVFGTRHDAERAGERIRAQLAQVHGHFAVELGEAQVGAGRGELNALGDFAELHRAGELAIQARGAADVRERGVVQPALHAYIAGDFIGAHRAVTQREAGIALYVFEGDIAP